MLQQLFSKIRPAHYDALNHILTLYQDTHWRRAVASAMLEGKPRLILDLCCGTGELSLELARKLTARSAEKVCNILGIDFCSTFLDYAREKLKMHSPTIKWVMGNAAWLPLPGESVDCIGITFSFRNLVYNNPGEEQHLNEIHRVLKKEGKLVIAETSQPAQPLIRWFFHLYLSLVVFLLGALISGNRSAYHYFADSARNFLDSERARELLLSHGFREVTVKSYLFGAVSFYVALK